MKLNAIVYHGKVKAKDSEKKSIEFTVPVGVIPAWMAEGDRRIIEKLFFRACLAGLRTYGAVTVVVESKLMEIDIG